MIETVTIVLAVVTGVGAITGAGYKCYRDMQNRPQQQDIVIHEPDRLPQVPRTPPPSPVLDNLVKQAMKNHMQQRESDGSDTDIDIHINIHTSNKDENSNSRPGSKEK